MLPDNFNNFWYPSKKEAELDKDKSILDFVGSPKPWDLFEKFIHHGYLVWNNYNSTFWKESYGRLSVQKLHRTFEIRRSIIKQIIDRVKGK